MKQIQHEPAKRSTSRRETSEIVSEADSDLFVGPEPELIGEQEANPGEAEYVLGPDGPAEQEPDRPSVAVRRAGKPKRGRPSLELTFVSANSAEEELARFRAKQNNPTGIKKQWASALAELSPEERSRLLAKQAEVAELVERMNDVIAGVGYGEGTGIAGATMYFPDLVFQDALTFLSQPGNELDR